MPVLKQCVVCGVQFSRPPSQAKTAKACSHACAVKVRAQTNRGEWALLACRVCGKAFEERQCHAGRRKTCSVSCGAVWKARTVPGRIGADNFHWKGGVTKHSGGYVYHRCVEHPFTSPSTPYVFEHRLVMEEWMRREAPDHPFLVEVDGEKYLDRKIHVHHRDEDRSNNAPENLQAMTNTAHRRWHESGTLPGPDECWPACHPGPEP